MAEVVVPYQPALTADKAMEIFHRGFWGKYQVYKTHFFVTRDFVVKKSPFTGVAVRVKQQPGQTSFGFAYMYPCPPLAMLCSLVVGWLLLYLVLRPGAKAMEEEVRSFIENAPEFGGAGALVEPVAPVAQTGSHPVFCVVCRAALSAEARFCHVCGRPVPEPELLLFCATCGAPLADEARFCHSCGAALSVSEPEPVRSAPDQLHCTQCGTQVPQSSRFCHACGAEVATVEGEHPEAIASPDPSTPEAGASQGYCAVCGQELGVNEKMRGLAAHEGCATPAFEEPAVPTVDTVRTEASVPDSPSTKETAQGFPRLAGHCEACGEELGVNEKLMGLTTHEKCPVPVTEARTTSPAQADQLYCTECGTPMPASSRFCHKCGSAAAAE